MDKQKTKVIFRKFKGGDIIALFPEIPGTNEPHTCQSYMHLGQHGACNTDIIYSTTLAQDHEYMSLWGELLAIGYNLQTVKRHTYKMYLKKIAELNRS